MAEPCAPLTIGWWNGFAAARGGEPPIIAASGNDTLTVETRADLSVVIHVWREKLLVPRHLVRPLLGGLLALDDVSLPSNENECCHRINDELMLTLEADASVVVVIGADDLPANAIEVPGIQIEKLRQTLRAVLK